jgi:TRAP-type C4-dicarboxylate transport system substrate-binding protein
MDQQLLDGLEEAGFVGFGLAGGGFALIMSNQPVTTLADMKAKKVWVPENDQATADSLKSLGLAPVPLQLTDVLTGLQTGLLDIVASPPVAAVVLQWHTKVRFVTDFPVLYTLGFMVIDKRAFARLTPEDQLVVRDVMGRIYEKFDTESVTDNTEARDALIATGLSVVAPQDGEVDKWRDQIATTNRELARRGLVQESTLDELLAHLEEFRRGEASGGAP